MNEHPQAPVQILVAELQRRHGIAADVALDMLERAARRKSVSLHDLAARVTGAIGSEPSTRAA